MPLDLPKPTEFAVPAFVFFVLVEMIYGWKTGRAKFEGKDSLTSLFMGLGSTVSGAITASLTFVVAYWVWENFRIFDMGASWPVFALALVLDDLAY